MACSHSFAELGGTAVCTGVLTLSYIPLYVKASWASRDRRTSDTLLNEGSFKI